MQQFLDRACSKRLNSDRVNQLQRQNSNLKLTLDGDDELRDDGKDFGSALFEHVESALDREESVWLLLLADSFEEDGEVVVVVEGHDVDFPKEFVLRAVVDGDGEVAPVVEATELGGWDGPSVGGTCSRFFCAGELFWLQQRGGVATNACSLLECCT